MRYYNSIVILIIFTLSLMSCKTLTKESFILESPTFHFKKNKLSESEWKVWQHKDLSIDSITGISLDRAYNELLKDKLGDTIIIGLLDNRIDKNHEDVKGILWKNTKEIQNNGIDDDNNGYVDDYEGWNFLGNKLGVQVDKASFESTRIVRKYKKVFENKTTSDIKFPNKNAYNQYLKALKSYNDEVSIVKNNLHVLDSIKELNNEIKNELQVLFPNKNPIEKYLDSINNTDTIVNKKIKILREYLENEDWYINREKRENEWLNIYLGLNYKERSVIGDDVENINDTDYGNNNIEALPSSSHNHAIKVAGVIGANRNNDVGIKGITNSIKIMPVCISPTGDEQDKDIALGIRYAVDNGAKILVITFTKYFSQRNDWILDAIKYAEKHDVLIVVSAGNHSKNLDIEKSFPNDYDENNREIVSNLIVVGAHTSRLKTNFVTSFSNYGKKNVDIFAPGRNIFTTFRNNKYSFDSGTSFSAPIVAGVASLIRSHYPSLTALEVKNIILESGVSIDIMVNKPSEDDEKELVPFSSLSQSGKIVNAYNALLMAKKVSKDRK